jgi:glutaredoxin
MSHTPTYKNSNSKSSEAETRVQIVGKRQSPNVGKKGRHVLWSAETEAVRLKR